MSDRDLERLRRGGHDHLKIYAAYKAAVEHQGQPTVILVKTVKGWMLGESATGRNATHQLKKLTEAELRKFRDLMALPIPDAQVGDAPYYHPGETSPEVEYLRECRRRLGGELPRRVVRSKPLELPREDLYAEFAAANQQPVSTTMAIVRLLRKLLDDKHIGRRIVPIIPDEARTFGMDFLFKKVGIYSAKGQLYDPVDSDLLFSYREAKDGQLLEEGITEAGAMGSFTAASTSYATHGEPVIPFYMFYSMFGFQRTGDQAWAVGDARGRGFLIGATAGRTTLNGEGLQHQDGHSHVLASTVPCCVQYDPAFHFEIAAIVRDGLRRMYEQGEDVFYYITVYNENYAMPAMPRGVEEGILRGLYLFKPCLDAKRHIVQIFGSGALMMQALEAQRILAERYDVAADVWSATSYRALRDDALQTEAWNLAHPLEKPRVPYLQKVLANAEGPIIAVSDYMKAWPDSIARWVRQPFLPLGTDGFGMSDTREQLRRHFKVDAASIAYAALYKLAEMGKLGFDEVARAGAELYGEAAVPEPVAGR